jgi:radical SAM superfamily enzyme YgiQ (UPF0313 family)
MRVVIADLKGRVGFVNKDTVVGGYGSRFQGFSWTTRQIERVRKLFQNVPSIHVGYLAAIFEQAGHDVRITTEEHAEGDVALILSSLVDYKHEVAWAREAKQKYPRMRVGFFGAPPTHMPELVQDAADFVIKGEPEQAGFRIAAGEIPSGVMASPAIDNLDSLPFPAWHLFNRKRGTMARSVRALHRTFPVLSSRSCPEFCTYCPHRITAPYRSRSAENVVEEIEYVFKRHGESFLVFRDPLFTEERERAAAIAEGILRRNLKVQFEVETRLDDLDKSLLELLHRAGLKMITFGVESMNPATLKSVGRRPIPPEHQREIISFCRDKEIRTEGFYVLGFLTDTVESIRATIDYAVELESTMALFKILTPFPGTPMFKHMKALITEPDWEKFDGLTPTFNHPNLTHEELRHLLGQAYCRFYIRPTFALNYLGINTPNEALRRLEAYTRRRQEENDLAFFEAQSSKVIEQ